MTCNEQRTSWFVKKGQLCHKLIWCDMIWHMHVCSRSLYTHIYINIYIYLHLYIYCHCINSHELYIFWILWVSNFTSYIFPNAGHELDDFQVTSCWAPHRTAAVSHGEGPRRGPLGLDAERPERPIGGTTKRWASWKKGPWLVGL